MIGGTMKFSLRINPGSILLQRTLLGPGGLRGDSRQEYFLGDKLPGTITYEQLRALGNGRVDIADNWRGNPRAVDRV